MSDKSQWVKELENNGQELLDNLVDDRSDIEIIFKCARDNKDFDDFKYCLGMHFRPEST